MRALPRTTAVPTARRGVTLTEVLVSLGIFGIGVVSLATLFPLSVLRTVQATTLTKATQLRYNAEGLIEAFPQIVHDPDNDGNVQEHRSESYVVDPTGFAEFGGGVQFYGHDDAGISAAGTRARYGSIVQATADFPTARDLVNLPDSFVDYFDKVPVAATTTTVDLASAADVGALAAGDRCILFHPDGRRSEVRTVNGIAGAQIDWLTPLDFTPERVIGQAEEARFSWMLTVRKSTNGDASVNVAVFFNRKLSREEEQVYQIAGTQEIQVAVAAGATEPNVKAGGYMLDAQNLLWYRIQRVGDTVGNTLNLTLAEPLSQPTAAAVFPERIVDVYPIGSFSEP